MTTIGGAVQTNIIAFALHREPDIISYPKMQRCHHIYLLHPNSNER